MKVLFLIFAIFLIACAPSFESTQNITEKPEIKPVVKENTTNVTKKITQANNTLPKNKIIKAEIKGRTHIIEVVDVTSDGRSCLLKVDGAPILIDEGETGTINGVRIFVIDVVSLRDYLQEKDECDLLVS